MKLRLYTSENEYQTKYKTLIRIKKLNTLSSNKVDKKS